MTYLKWWREASILALAVLLACAIHSCSSAKEETLRIKAEDSALAENQRRENEQKARADQKAHEDAIHEYQNELAHLRDDTRIASIRVCARASSPSAVPAKTEPAAGAYTEDASNVPPAPAGNSGTDVGPVIDAIVRQCDDLAVRHTALVNWIEATR